jgi:hypothetical protein
MTIGLQTIRASPRARIVVMAAGEGKASVVRAAVESVPSPATPATALHGHPGVRLYVTHGAALSLSARSAETVRRAGDDALTWALAHLSGSDTRVAANLVQPPQSFLCLERACHELSLTLRVPLHQLAPRVLDLLRPSDCDNDDKELRQCVERGPETESSNSQSLSVSLSLSPSLAAARLVAQSLPDWLVATDASCRQSPLLALSVICTCAARRLREKVVGGLAASSATDTRLMHTAPHHDDILLSYHAALHSLLGRQKASAASASAADPVAAAAERRARTASFSSDGLALGEAFNGNVNHFAYLTSGFHSVNDDLLRSKCDALLAPTAGGSAGGAAAGDRLAEIVQAGLLSSNYDALLAEFRAAFVCRDTAAQDAIEDVIFLRKVCEVWSRSPTQAYNSLTDALRADVQWIRDDYLATHSPGDAVPIEMQLLKGCIRESEVDRVWALSRMPMSRVHHLRSKFYTDDFFTPMPSVEDDALPFANLLRDQQPQIVTVAFDPEGTGPDTHYKVSRSLVLNQSDF